MKLKVKVVSGDTQKELKLTKELSAAIRGLPDVEVYSGSDKGDRTSQVVFVDAGMSDLDGVLESIDRKGKAVFLLVHDGDEIPESLTDGRVDDVLVHPFRSLEVLSKLKHYQQILMWEEVSRLNATFSETLELLREDLRLAERLQKAKLPKRFKDVQGLEITNRYLAGLKSGGDYFDIAESADRERVSLVLSDSSSYGLSSAVLSALVRVTMKLTADETRSCADTVTRILDELKLALGEKDQLSLFYGIISRTDSTLRYLNLGTSRAFYRDTTDSRFEELQPQGGTVHASGRAGLKLAELDRRLNPGSRLVLLSDGFIDTAGGPEETRILLDEFTQSDRRDLVNELAFRLKSRFGDDELPEQDCTGVVLDVGDLSAKVIRLGSKKRA